MVKTYLGWSCPISTVVEHSTHNPKIVSSNPATVIRRVNGENLFKGGLAPLAQS
jgi:hypothetical protein